MQKIKMMTDSASDISAELEKELDIEILSFPITIGDKSYMERVDFTNQEFYNILLNEPTIPSTSQITAFVFEEKYEEIYSEGFTDLIYVSINSTGSNTNVAAHMARESFFKKNPDAKTKFNIHIVDSKAYCIAYGFAVINAAKKVKKGTCVREILGYLEDWYDSVEIYFAPYTLEFVKKSGRVSCAAAFMGELLGLRPIISIIDGKTQIVEKVRGDKAIIPALIKHAKEKRVPNTPILLVKGMMGEEAIQLKEITEKTFKTNVEGVFEVGAAISINAGPKIVGIIIKGENRR